MFRLFSLSLRVNAASNRYCSSPFVTAFRSWTPICSLDPPVSSGFLLILSPSQPGLAVNAPLSRFTSGGSPGFLLHSSPSQPGLAVNAPLSRFTSGGSPGFLLHSSPSQLGLASDSPASRTSGNIFAPTTFSQRGLTSDSSPRSRTSGNSTAPGIFSGKLRFPYLSGTFKSVFSRFSLGDCLSVTGSFFLSGKLCGCFSCYIFPSSVKFSYGLCTQSGNLKSDGSVVRYFDKVPPTGNLVLAMACMPTYILEQQMKNPGWTRRIFSMRRFFVHNLRWEDPSNPNPSPPYIPNDCELILFERKLIQGGISLRFLMDFWPNIFLDLDDYVEFSFERYFHWCCQHGKHGFDISTNPVDYVLGTKDLYQKIISDLDGLPHGVIMPLSAFKSFLKFDCTLILLHHRGSLVLRIREIHIPFSASGQVMTTAVSAGVNCKVDHSGWNVDHPYWKHVLNSFGLSESLVILDTYDPPVFGPRERLMLK